MDQYKERKNSLKRDNPIEKEQVITLNKYIGYILGYIRKQIYIVYKIGSDKEQ